MLRINIPWLNGIIDAWDTKPPSQFDQTPTSKALWTNGWSFTGGKSPSVFLGSTLLPSGLKMDRVVIVWENKLAKWVFGSIFEIHWYLSLSNLISRSPFLLVKFPFWRFSHPSNHTGCGSRTNSDLPNLIFDKQHLRVSGWKLPPWNCVSPPETADVSSRSKYIHSWESSPNVCFLRSGATYILSQHPKAS